MQTFIESGDLRLNEIKVRFDELPNIFNKFDTVQDKLELSDDTDHSGDRESFERHYYEVKAISTSSDRLTSVKTQFNT